MHLALLQVGPSGGVGDLLATERRWQADDPAGVDAALSQLAELPQARLVIAAEGVRGLNLALSRLMRRGLLAGLDTAVLLAEPGHYLTGLGLPRPLSAQAEIARTASTRLVGVLKDDSGGLCLDSARLSAWDPAGSDEWWVRAVVDDERLCDGPVRELSVRRLGPSELEATVTVGRLRRRRVRGRSLQLACDPAQIVADGAARERPRSKRTFWSEPELWRLAIP